MAANPALLGYNPFPKTPLFLTEQKELQDAFEYYRVHGPLSAWEIGSLTPGGVAQILARRVPRVRRRDDPGPIGGLPRPALDPMNDIPGGPLDVKIPDRAFTRVILDTVQARRNLQTAGVRFVRTLGDVSPAKDPDPCLACSSGELLG